MAHPTAAVEIINLALLQLHQAPITSLDDSNNNAADAAQRIYDFRRRVLLENHIWNFARKRALALKEADNTPLFDYESFYILPNDCLRVHWVGEDWLRYEQGVRLKYDIQGRKLLLNSKDGWWSQGESENSVKILFTQDVTDIGVMSPLFVQLFALDLAEWLCMPVTGDARLRAELTKARTAALAEAVAVNHQQRPTRVTEIDFIREARGTLSDYPDIYVDSSGIG